MTKNRIAPLAYLFPMPAVLIGALVDGRPNYLTAAYAGVMCKTPPTIGVGLMSGEVRYTRKGMEEQGFFSINVPRADQAEVTDYCGVVSGRRTDKSGVFTDFYGEGHPKVPLIEECPVNLVCRLSQIVPIGSHDALLGEVVDCYADQDVLDGDHPAMDKVDPLVYAPGHRSYWRVGVHIGPSHQIGWKRQPE